MTTVAAQRMTALGARPRTQAVLRWSLVPLAITLTAWQPLQLVPGLGIDASWQAGLEIATHEGIPFGTHLVFTYGPLGFLSVQQLWYHGLGELAFAYTAIMRFALAAALFFAARRSFGTWIGLLVALVVATIDLQLAEMVVVLIAAAAAVVDGVRGRGAYLLVGLSGAFAGLEMLNKVSIGISLAVMVIVLVLALDGSRLRYTVAALASFVVAFLVLWFATGQSLGTLPDYLSNSEQIVSGYGAAMMLSDPTLAWAYAAAFFGLAAGVWGAAEMTRGLPARRSAGVIGLWVVFWFFAFKEGFVRQDAIHTGWFLEALLGGFVALRWRREHRGVALAVTSALVIFALAATSGSLSRAFAPYANARAAEHDFRSVFGSTRARQIRDAGRAAIIGAAPIDPRSLRLLAGHTVAVYPLEISVVWAYGLKWDPFPVEQAYSAYTTHLDNLDAAYLGSRDAPERVLVGPYAPAIDGPITSFNEPATVRAILCRYGVLRATTRYVVLGRVADRCGEPRLLRTVHAAWGQSVTVPSPPGPNSFVIARVSGIGPGPLESLRGLLWKPDMRFVSVNGGAPQQLTGATAGDGLLLRAGPGVDLPAPFNFFAGANAVAVSSAGAGFDDGQPVTYRFYAQSLS